MTRQYPFQVKSVEDFKMRIQNGEKIQFDNYFLNDAKYENMIDLIYKLTEYNDVDRISWNEFVNHPYIVEIMENKNDLSKSMELC